MGGMYYKLPWKHMGCIKNEVKGPVDKEKCIFENIEKNGMNKRICAFTEKR